MNGEFSWKVISGLRNFYEDHIVMMLNIMDRYLLQFFPSACIILYKLTRRLVFAGHILILPCLS